MNSVVQPEDALPYELLLRKSCSAAPGDEREAAIDGASTAEPSESESCSTCSDSGTLAPAPAARFVPAKSNVRLLRNVAVHGTHGDARLEELVRQVRLLSEKVFEEDCLEEVTRKSGWKLSVLASDDQATLCGFAVAKTTAGGVLSIAKIAVPEEFRGCGLGKLIMEELMKAARKQGDIYEVCLSSLPNAVGFYQRLGFKAFKGLKLNSQEDLVEGQVYMEKKLRPRRR